MKRRSFLRAGVVGVLSATAGCTSAAVGTNQGRVVSKTVLAGDLPIAEDRPGKFSVREGYAGASNSTESEVNTISSTTTDSRTTDGETTDGEASGTTSEEGTTSWNASDGNEGGGEGGTTLSAGNLTVGEEFANHLRKEFGSLAFVVSIVHYKTAWPNEAEVGEHKRYTTYRSLFNRIQVGESITFQPDPTSTSTLSSVSCVAKDRESLQVRCSTGDNDGSPV
ncbi:hypothetical protein [Halomicrococcus sp. SG-WS-1]|uniref:hypothetical protein n=1 Tax=Halomicrococcus sp. SG-WS-1 TaxID=3439057 RepID=UPI003F7AEADE